MNNFWARNRSKLVSWRRMPSVAVAALVMVSGLLAVTGRAQTSFASAQVISGTTGTVTNSNVGVVPTDNPPNIAGFAPNAPLVGIHGPPR